MIKDDDDSTFRSLAAATTKVLSKIKQIEQVREVDEAKANKAASGERENRQDEKGHHRSYVDHRLAELSAFERRASGKGFQRRTGRRMKK